MVRMITTIPSHLLIFVLKEATEIYVLIASKVMDLQVKNYALNAGLVIKHCF